MESDLEVKKKKPIVDTDEGWLHLVPGLHYPMAAVYYVDVIQHTIHLRLIETIRGCLIVRASCVETSRS